MNTDEIDESVRDGSLPAYEPPAVRELGSLAELTLGGTGDGVPDGFGYSGAVGSI